MHTLHKSILVLQLSVNLIDVAFAMKCLLHVLLQQMLAFARLHSYIWAHMLWGGPLETFKRTVSDLRNFALSSQQPKWLVFFSPQQQTKLLSRFKAAHHVDDHNILHNDCTTQYWLLSHTSCICFLLLCLASFHSWRSSNVLLQILLAVALLHKHHISDIVYNVLFSHRIHVCQSTLSMCKTRDICSSFANKIYHIFCYVLRPFNVCENNFILIFAMHCKISESEHIPWARHDKICSSSLQQHIFCHHLQLLLSQKKMKNCFIFMSKVVAFIANIVLFIIMFFLKYTPLQVYAPT